MSSYDHTKAYRARQRAKGKCIICGKESAPFVSCASCRAKNYALVMAHKATLHERGICRSCHRPLPEHRADEMTCGWCRQDRYQGERAGWK